MMGRQTNDQRQLFYLLTSFGHGPTDGVLTPARPLHPGSPRSRSADDTDARCPTFEEFLRNAIEAT